MASPTQTEPLAPSVGVTSDPDRTNGADQRLQEVLPAIKDLAMRVGGFKKLAEIVNELARDQS